MSESYTFYAATLGCKINQYETQALREVWIARGFLESDSAAGADFILVNSCAVTAKAVSDVRSTVRQLHRANENAQIVVTGCAAQVMGDELKVLPGVVRIVPQDAKTSLKTWPELKEGMTEPENVFPDYGERGLFKHLEASNEEIEKLEFAEVREAVYRLKDNGGVING
jgi:tRNA A37 methylthiotransferase MiaB